MSQLAAARFGFFAFVLAALTAAAAVGGVRLGLISYANGLALMIPATLLGISALGLALTWAARAWKHNDGTGRRPGMAALFGSLLLLYPPAATGIARLTTPALYDFSTNTGSPPRFVALLKFRGEGANAPAFDGDRQVAYDGEMHTVSYVLHDRYFDLMKPRAGFAVGAKNPVTVFFWRDFEAVKKTGWTIVDFSEGDARIEATHASFWFGRMSDIVVQIRPSGLGARTDIRSQSRYDARDDGFNAANVKRFLTILAKR